MASHYFLILSCFIFITCGSSSDIDPEWKVFSDPAHEKYLMVLLAVHVVTGDVYVGAANAIFHLDADLNLKQKVITGPKAVCPTPEETCAEGSKVLKDNAVLSIIILYHLTPHMLMMCTKLYEGTCELRPLDNLESSFSIGPYADISAHCPTGRGDPSFMAPGPRDPFTFYSGATMENNLIQTKETPAFISSKVLRQENGQFRFEYSEKTDQSLSAIFFKTEPTVIHLYSFDYGRYAYFLYLRIPTGNVPARTVLARVCLRDGTFHSFVEIGLSCRKDNHNFPIAVAAYLASERTQPLKTLYLAFWKIHEGCTICRFDMETIDTYFNNVVRECFNGSSNSTYLMDTTTGDLHRCNKADFQPSDLCGSSTNPTIYSDRIFQTRAVIIILVREFHIKTLVVRIENDTHTAFIGAKHGIYSKILLQPSIRNLYVGKASDHTILESTFDLKKENVYFLFSNKIVKFPMNTCSIYRTCSSCFEEKLDPLHCGWCDGRCAQLHECSKPERFSRNRCSPAIFSFSPTFGPTQGGTYLTIVGNNFGNHHSSSSTNHVLIGGVVCSIALWENERILCTTKPAPAEFSSPVEVKINDAANSSIPFVFGGSAQSEEVFKFIKPVIFGILPGRGSTNGGTNVTLYGRHLDIGHRVSLNVNGRSCTNLRVEKLHVKCTTGRFADPTLENKIQLKIDDIRLEITEADNPAGTFSSKEFKYLLDPEILKIHPTEIIFSYRGNITVTGYYLDSPESPRMKVKLIHDNKKLEFRETCSQIPDSRGTQMSCSMPVLEPSAVSFPRTQNPFLIAEVNFSMFPFKENFPELKESRIWIFPDPQYEPFPKVQEITQDGPHLEIKGKFVDSKYLPEMITVTVGEKELCNISELTSGLLKCDLSKDLMANASLWGKNLSVKVLSGAASSNLGYLVILKEPESVPDAVTSMSWPIVLAIVLVVILCLAAAIGAWCFYRKREQKSPNNFSYNVRAIPGAVRFRNDYRPVPHRPRPEAPAAVPPQMPPEMQLPLIPIRTFSRQPSTSTTTSSLLSRTPSVPPAEIVAASPIDEISHPGYLGMNKQKSPIGSVPTESELTPTESSVSSAYKAIQQGIDNKEEIVPVEETIRLLIMKGLVIEKEQLTLGDYIGEGQFGCIVKGNYKCPTKGYIDVAVKMLKYDSEVNERTVRGFLDEGVKMMNFHHDHVIELLGICFDFQGPVIVLSFMQNGDLCAYLKSEDINLSKADLLRFATHIASGMEYLSQAKFVHRDLAARNCLLDGDLRVKIADFGLTRNIYESHYYKSQSKCKLPIKWMAPESIEKGFYTAKSDVWSYGVVFWEIMTRGVLPYKDIDNWVLLELIKGGRRLPMPSSCGKLLYHVMMQCWELEPSNRPSFEVIHKVIKERWNSISYKDRLESIPANNEEYAECG